MENQWEHAPETERPATREALPAWVPPSPGFKPESLDTPAMKGSVQQNLSRNLGVYVVVEFLVGGDHTFREGILYSVGTAYFTLYEERTETLVMCDISSVKFVTFYRPGHRPQPVGGTPQTQGNTAGGVPQPGAQTFRQSGPGGVINQGRTSRRR